MEIVINRTRVKGNFALLIPTHRQEQFPYLPEHLNRVPHRMVDPRAMPDWTANDWFFLTHLLRGRVRSDMTTAGAIRLRRIHPELFDPFRAARLSAEAVDDRLRHIFGTVPTRQRYGQAWQRNAEILTEGWDGDILNVYEGVTTEAEVRARVMNKERYELPPRERGFYMFQAKMAALLTINLMRARFIHRISMSFPVDFHHMRALISLGMLSLPNGSYRPEPIMAAGDQVGRWYLNRFPEMDPVVFSEYLFVLSREVCARAVHDPEADWDDSAVVDRYQRTCARCPVEHRCHKTVLSKDYYPDGKGAPRRITVIDRPKPPRRVINLIAA